MKKEVKGSFLLLLFLLVSLISSMMTEATYQENIIQIDIKKAISRYFANIEANSLTKWDIDTDNLPFTRIYFNVNKNLTKATIKLELLNTNPSSKTDHTITFYNFFRLSSSGFLDSLSNASIYFKIEKSWLIKNNLSSRDIRMYALVNNSWIEKETRFIGSDNHNLIFVSSFDRFGFYALGAKHKIIKSKNKAIKENKPVRTTTENKKAIIKPREDYTKKYQEKSSPPGLKIWRSTLIFLVLIFIILFILFIGTFLKQTQKR